MGEGGLLERGGGRRGPVKRRQDTFGQLKADIYAQGNDHHDAFVADRIDMANPAAEQRRQLAGSGITRNCLKTRCCTMNWAEKLQATRVRSSWFVSSRSHFQFYGRKTLTQRGCDYCYRSPALLKKTPEEDPAPIKKIPV